MAGQLKRENPTLREDVVLIRALRDSNLPKFLVDDARLFSVSTLQKFKCSPSKAVYNDIIIHMASPLHDPAGLIYCTQWCASISF